MTRTPTNNYYKELHDLRNYVEAVLKEKVILEDAGLLYNEFIYNLGLEYALSKKAIEKVVGDAIEKWKLTTAEKDGKKIILLETEE